MVNTINSNVTDYPEVIELLKAELKNCLDLLQ